MLKNLLKVAFVKNDLLLASVALPMFCGIVAEILPFNKSKGYSVGLCIFTVCTCWDNSIL